MTTMRDPGWWYWLVTVGFLGAGLSGLPQGFFLAILLCVAQVAHVSWLTHDVTAFPVQVRVAYLAMLANQLGAVLPASALVAQLESGLIAAGLLAGKYLSASPWPLFAIAFAFVFLSLAFSKLRPVLIWPMVFVVGWTNFSVRTSIISPFDLRRIGPEWMLLCRIRTQVLFCLAASFCSCG